MVVLSYSTYSQGSGFEPFFFASAGRLAQSKVTLPNALSVLSEALSETVVFSTVAALFIC
jgi:hypothetical protein